MVSTSISLFFFNVFGEAKKKKKKGKKLVLGDEISEWTFPVLHWERKRVRRTRF